MREPMTIEGTMRILPQGNTLKNWRYYFFGFEAAVARQTSQSQYYLRERER